MPQLVTENLSLKTWVRDRILFLALVIFLLGGTFYIGAGKFLDPQNEWLHSYFIFSARYISFGWHILYWCWKIFRSTERVAPPD